MADRELEKKIEQAEYRAKLIEAELNAVRSSKAYQLSKKAGIIKSQIANDPVGLTKKAAKMLVTNPKKARHMFRSASHGAFNTQSIVEQTAKYQEWILLNEPDESEIDDQRLAAEKLKKKPLFSIVTPVFNPPARVFEDLIETVLDQTYPYFELCLGNFGDDQEIDDIITRYAKLDDRVKHYKFTENKGIAFNSNQILGKVKGDYIALLDHDDTISADALYENAVLINEKPYDFIYSDKDKIDERNNRFDPLFKTKLSPEMLLNINYLTHLNIMRTSLVKKIGGWDPITDGAQDWDLFLRLITEAKHVAHIPKVLYHWRVIATSTAMSIETKPYALANQCKAVDKYLATIKVPANAYVEGTELFLQWNESIIDKFPVFFISFSTSAHSTRTIRRIKRAVSDAQVIVLVEKNKEESVNSIVKNAAQQIISYDKDGLTKAVSKYVNSGSLNSKTKNALFLIDTIQLPSEIRWYDRLTGWLSIPEVGGVSGRLVNSQDLIVSSGGLITPEGNYFPIFNGYPRYYQSYIGNAEWVRNLSIINPFFCATELDTLKKFKFGTYKTDQEAFDAYFMDIAKKGRLVMTPHVTAVVKFNDVLDKTRPIEILKSAKTPFIDPFSNINMSSQDPLRLFNEEELTGVTKQAEAVLIDSYQHDATILAGTFDITNKQIEDNKSLVSRVNNDPAHSVAWLVPGFDGVYAGLINIFSFANYLSVEKGMATTIYVLTGSKDASSEQEQVVKAFPKLNKANFVAIKPDQAAMMKPHDIGIATQWATTFPLAKSNDFKRKYYFIQDNEANFYPKGSISALVELSYTFGFTAIAGTKGLLDMYKDEYQGKGIILKSKIDLGEYQPRKDIYYIPQKPYKVFFYARPNMPRNAFELGIAGLKKLKQDMGEEVEIITAGAAWDSKSYGVDGMFTNLGKIAYNAVPKLYRTVDAGLMFMFSGHPGVTASELMASGCPVVVNEYDDVTWHELYQDGKTCLTTKATASEVARNLKLCLTDENIRRKLIDGGLAKSHEFYEGYDESLKTAFQYVGGGNKPKT